MANRHKPKKHVILIKEDQGAQTAPLFTGKVRDNTAKLIGKGLPILAKVDTRESLASKANVSHGTFDKGIKIPRWKHYHLV